MTAAPEYSQLHFGRQKLSDESKKGFSLCDRIIIAIGIGFTGTMIGICVSMAMEWRKFEVQVRTAEVAAAFHSGEIVKTSIADFRGMIVRRTCQPNGCWYLVRFNVASMEPQWLSEIELERVK